MDTCISLGHCSKLSAACVDLGPGALLSGPYFPKPQIRQRKSSLSRRARPFACLAKLGRQRRPGRRALRYPVPKFSKVTRGRTCRPGRVAPRGLRGLGRTLRSPARQPAPPALTLRVAVASASALPCREERPWLCGVLLSAAPPPPPPANPDRRLSSAHPRRGLRPQRQPLAEDHFPTSRNYDCPTCKVSPSTFKIATQVTAP